MALSDRFTKLLNTYDIRAVQAAVSELLIQHPLKDNQLSLVHRPNHVDDRWTDGSGSSMEFDKEGKPVCGPDGLPTRRFVEEEFTILNPEIADGVLGQIYKDFAKDYRLSRYRLAALKPKSCYSWHYDEEVRIHVPVFTTPGSFLITEDGVASHLPADGGTYLFDARSYHTALNADRVNWRYHLLINILRD